MKEHAARRVHAHLGKELWVLERQLDDLAQLGDLRGAVRVRSGYGAGRGGCRVWVLGRGARHLL